MTMQVQPDLDFIRDMRAAGGDTLKKCYQCATCSVVCPLSKDDNPFPRREMLFAQWGLKDKLIADPNVLLCHQCGDCSAYCPRGARPGDVLGAIRAYVYKYYGWPVALASLAASGKNLPILIGLPAVIIFVLWLMSGGMHIPAAADFTHYGYSHFFGHWNFRLLSKNVFFIWLFILPSVAIAGFSAYKGVRSMWQKMCETSGVGEPLYRPSVIQFIKEFLLPAAKEIIDHNRFKECTTNADRVIGHKPLLLAFLTLAFVTAYSAFTQDILGIFWPALHGPISMWNPIKFIANIGAVAMIYGIVSLWKNRTRMETEGLATRSFYDWFLIWMIMGVGLTGFAAQVFRLLGMASIGYLVYYLHLISVMMLFLYLPYTKFAHLIYRTAAMAFERYRVSGYVNKA